MRVKKNMARSKNKKMVSFFIWVSVIGGILTLIGLAGYRIYSGKASEEKEELASQERKTINENVSDSKDHVINRFEDTDSIITQKIDEAKSEIRKRNNVISDGQKRIEKKIDDFNDPALIVDSGFSFYIALTTNLLSDRRRKYLFDYGQNETSNRVSLYFDAENNLIFRLIDEVGEINSCKVPESSYTFHDGVPFFIFCDVGLSSDYSFMRIRINGKEVSRNQVEYKMNYISNEFYDHSQRSAFSMVRKLGRLKSDSSTKKFFNPQYSGAICADVNGENPSNFWPLEFQIYGWPLKKEEVDLLWEEARDIVFGYSQFIKRSLNPFKSAYKIDEQGNIVLIE